MKSLAVVLTLVSFCSLAQITTPQPSPTAYLRQNVGVTTVEIEYSRPGVKGRKIMGGLLPFGEVWRTGANSPTKIVFGDDVQIGEVNLPKGEYTILTIPDRKEWKISFYAFDNGYWSSYINKEPIVTVLPKIKEVQPLVETLTIELSGLEDNGGEIQISWENTSASIPFLLNTDKLVSKQIDQFTSNPLNAVADDYYSAASYYLTNKKDLNKALEWIEEATKIKEKAFWMWRKKAEIQAALGDKKAAVASYDKSSKIAKERGNESYARQNEEAKNALKE